MFYIPKNNRARRERQNRHGEFLKFKDGVLVWESGKLVKIGQNALLADDWFIDEEVIELNIYDIEEAIESAWYSEDSREFTNIVLKALGFKGEI